MASRLSLSSNEGLGVDLKKDEGVTQDEPGTLHIAESTPETFKENESPHPK